MKRLQAAQESQHEFYYLPTKTMKFTLKTHPSYSLQVLKGISMLILNSGEKVLIFNLTEGLGDGTSGLKQCLTNGDIIQSCKFTTTHNKRGQLHPQYLQSVYDQRNEGDDNSSGGVDPPLIKQFRYIDDTMYCVLFKNGQGALVRSKDDSAVYLNDILWDAKYQDIPIFDVTNQCFKQKVRDLTESIDHFLPIDLISTKLMHNKLLIVAAIDHYAFLFQNSQPFFTLSFDKKIQYLKIQKNDEVQTMKILVHTEDEVHLLDINFDKLILKMVYSISIKVELHNNQICSLYMDNKWYLALGQTLLQFDFEEQKYHQIYQSGSILSPITKINKVIIQEQQLIAISTLDNLHTFFKPDSKSTHNQVLLKLSLNCFTLLKLSKLSSAYIGIGNCNNASGDPKQILFLQFPQTSTQDFISSSLISLQNQQEDKLTTLKQELSAIDFVFAVERQIFTFKALLKDLIEQWSKMVRVDEICGIDGLEVVKKILNKQEQMENEIDQQQHSPLQVSLVSKLLFQLLLLDEVGNDDDSELKTFKGMLLQVILYYEYTYNKNLNDITQKLDFIKQNKLYPYSTTTDIQQSYHGNQFDCPICSVNYECQDVSELFYGQDIKTLHQQLQKGYVSCQNGHEFQINYRKLNVYTGVGKLSHIRCERCHSLRGHQQNDSDDKKSSVCFICNYKQ